jgi:acyl-CoA synthetase (AMP-forming)/AMP-acid ligase II
VRLSCYGVEVTVDDDDRPVSRARRGVGRAAARGPGAGPGHDLDPGAVHAHCRDRLPAIKRPARATILQAMPKTSTVKISKPQLLT